MRLIMAALREFARRPILWGTLCVVLVVVAVADLVAAGLLAIGLGLLGFALARRSPGALRTSALVGIVAVTGVMVMSALAFPAYSSGRLPLQVPGSSVGSDRTNRSGFDLATYVVSDNGGAAGAIDRYAPMVSTVPLTGAYIGRDGRLSYIGARDALLHAHLGGARAELVLQNYDPLLSNFSPALGHLALNSPTLRHQLASDLANLLASEGWDGVVVDLESLPNADAPSLTQFVRELRSLIGSRRLVVTVPVDSSGTAGGGAYDLAGLAAAADQVQLMAYDQHDPTSDPGPIASLGWVRTAITSALASVPKSKLTLGIAAYGYTWSRTGVSVDQDVTPSHLRARAKAQGVTPQWVPSIGEWYVRFRNGEVSWFSDARSVALRLNLARTMGLGGAAIWEMTTSDPLAASVLGPVQRIKVAALTDRPVQPVPGRGLVALTFDDGPSSAWTPQILSVLEKYHVPATFFVIGNRAMVRSDLITRMIADGDVIGNHTYSHLNLSRVPQWRARMDILAGQWAIQGITGRKPLLFRSPYGAGELTGGNGSSGDALARSMGMMPVNWTVDTNDWAQPGVQAIVSSVTQNAYDRMVILLHDGGGNRAQTLAALPLIIENLKAQGYTFTTVDRIDGSITAAYATANGPGAVLRSVELIASYQLWKSAHDTVRFTLLGLGIAGLLRLLASWPLALRHRRRSRRQVLPRATDLTVSVVIPAHNEERVISNTLNSLMHLRGPIAEVIVAENGSTDATAEIADTFPVRVLRLGAVGKAGAMNAALEFCTGDVVVVLDADTVVTPNFVQAVLPHFADPMVGAVAGNVKVGNRQRLMARLQSLEYIASLNIDRRAQAQVGVVAVVPGAAGAFRREALRRVGGWPTDTLVEDADLTVELLLAGYRIPYEERAVSLTEAPETASDVLKQRRRWAYGTVEVAAKHGRRFFDRKSGRVGLLSLPWSLMTQVVLPIAGPIVDAFLLWLVITGNSRQAAGILGLALLGDLVVSAWALRVEGESLRLLWYVPLARLVWRPLLMFAVIGSAKRWITGRHVRWRKVTRRNTVRVAQLTSTR